MEVARVEDDVADGDFVEISCASSHDVHIDFAIGENEGSGADIELELRDTVQFKAIDEDS